MTKIIKFNIDEQNMTWVEENYFRNDTYSNITYNNIDGIIERNLVSELLQYPNESLSKSPKWMHSFCYMTNPHSIMTQFSIRGHSGSEHIISALLSSNGSWYHSTIHEMNEYFANATDIDILSECSTSITDVPTWEYYSLLIIPVLIVAIIGCCIHRYRQDNKKNARIYAKTMAIQKPLILVIPIGKYDDPDWDYPDTINDLDNPRFCPLEHRY